MKKHKLILPAFALIVALTLGGCKDNTTDDVPELKPEIPQTEQPEPEPEPEIEPEIDFEKMFCTNPQSCIDAYNSVTKLECAVDDRLNIPWSADKACDMRDCDVEHRKSHGITFDEVYDVELKKYVKKEKIFTHNEEGIYKENGYPCTHNGMDYSKANSIFDYDNAITKVIGLMYHQHFPYKHFDVDKCIEIDSAKLLKEDYIFDIYKD
jgi:hypothetical protein